MLDAVESQRQPVDVVILGWNDGPLLDAAIESALTSEGINVVVHVVDNGSEPARSRVPDDSRVKLLRNEVDLGVAPARNQGVMAGGAPVVCLLDSDARLHPGSLATLVEALLGEPSYGLTAPVFSGQRPEDSAGRRPTLARKILRLMGLTGSYSIDRSSSLSPSESAVAASRPVEVAIGACQVFRRQAFEDVGGIDESYFYGPRTSTSA